LLTAAPDIVRAQGCRFCASLDTEIVQLRRLLGASLDIVRAEGRRFCCASLAIASSQEHNFFGASLSITPFLSICSWILRVQPDAVF
jgi:hypothetical protein